MSLLLELLLLFQSAGAPVEGEASQRAVVEAVRRLEASGRMVEAVASPSDRVALPRGIAPGEPPVLRFRFLDGQARHRFGNSGLVLDDAGH